MSTLAGRSPDAAKEIKALISSSVERDGKGTEIVNAAGQTMEEAVTAIQRVITLMTDISAASAASAEQSSGMGQIGEAVQPLDQATRQNAALVEELSAAARSLQDQAKAQVQTIAVFTLAGDPASAVQQPTAQHHAAPHARVAPLAANASQRLLQAAARVVLRQMFGQVCYEESKTRISRMALPIGSTRNAWG